MSFAKVFHLHWVLHCLHPGSRVHSLHNAVGGIDFLIEGKVYLTRLQEDRLVSDPCHRVVDRVVFFDGDMILLKISAELRGEFAAVNKKSRLILCDQGECRCQYISVVGIFADIKEPCHIVKA